MFRTLEFLRYYKALIRPIVASKFEILVSQIRGSKRKYLILYNLVNKEPKQIIYMYIMDICWPLVPKFAGSNPAEAVGFLGAK